MIRGLIAQSIDLRLVVADQEYMMRIGKFRSDMGGYVCET